MRHEIPTMTTGRTLERPPHGKAELIATFGDPRRTGWAARNLVLVSFPSPLTLSFDRSKVATRCLVHRLVRDRFEAVFTALDRADLWKPLETFGGTYAHRPIVGSSRLSTHAFGIAIDIDVLRNPFGSPPTLSPHVVEIFRAEGFKWGGEFRRPDGMHFQFATGY